MTKIGSKKLTIFLSKIKNFTSIEIQNELKFLSKKPYSDYTYVLYCIKEQDTILKSFIEFIRVITPSSLKIFLETSVSYHEIENMEGFYYNGYKYNNIDITNNFKRCFHLSKGDIGFVKYLLGNFLTQKIENSVRKIIQVYQHALNSPHNYMRFLLFVTIVESLIKDDTTTGISFKQSRMMAILIGQSEIESNFIFKNYKEIYKKRNALVHTGVFEVEGFVVEYLQYLICELIISLLLMNNEKIKDVFSWTVPLAFGERHKLIDKTHAAHKDSQILRNGFEIASDLFPKKKENLPKKKQ